MSDTKTPDPIDVRGIDLEPVIQIDEAVIALGYARTTAVELSGVLQHLGQCQEFSGDANVYKWMEDKSAQCMTLEAENTRLRERVRELEFALSDALLRLRSDENTQLRKRINELEAMLETYGH
jgi:predicted nuclease with TOPRIM domain